MKLFFASVLEPDSISLARTVLRWPGKNGCGVWRRGNIVWFLDRVLVGKWWVRTLRIAIVNELIVWKNGNCGIRNLTINIRDTRNTCRKQGSKNANFREKHQRRWCTYFKIPNFEMRSSQQIEKYVIEKRITLNE